MYSTAGGDLNTNVSGPSPELIAFAAADNGIRTAGRPILATGSLNARDLSWLLRAPAAAKKQTMTPPPRSRVT